MRHYIMRQMILRARHICPGTEKAQTGPERATGGRAECSKECGAAPIDVSTWSHLRTLRFDMGRQVTCVDASRNLLCSKLLKKQSRRCVTGRSFLPQTGFTYFESPLHGQRWGHRAATVIPRKTQSHHHAECLQLVP